MKKVILFLILAAGTTFAASSQTVIINPNEKRVLGLPGGNSNDKGVLGVPGSGPVIISPSPEERETRVRRHKNLPPGQAKKIYGHQSAREFAPGQQKKRWKGNSNDNNEGNGNNKGKGKGKGKWKNKD